MNKEDADRVNSGFVQVHKDIAELKIRLSNSERQNAQNAQMIQNLQSQIGHLIARSFNGGSTVEDNN
jgi:hypothetical protein